MGATHGYSADQPEEEAHKNSWGEICCILLVVFTIAGTVVGIFAAAQFYDSQTAYQVPHYSVAIDSVSGLDPKTDLGRRPALNPEFNITLRVASQGIWVTECAEPGMYVEVSYREVSLAASATLIQQICAEPMEAAEHRLVARGAGVVVPGSMLDSLAMDMRSGMPKFDVQLHGPNRRKVAWSCGPRLVGDPNALQTECS